MVTFPALPSKIMRHHICSLCNVIRTHEIFAINTDSFTMFLCFSFLAYLARQSLVFDSSEGFHLALDGAHDTISSLHDLSHVGRIQRSPRGVVLEEDPSARIAQIEPTINLLALNFHEMVICRHTHETTLVNFHLSCSNFGIKMRLRTFRKRGDNMALLNIAASFPLRFPYPPLVSIHFFCQLVEKSHEDWHPRVLSTW